MHTALWNQWHAEISLGTRDQWYGRKTSVCIFTATGTQTDSNWFIFEQESKLREQEIHLACFEIRGGKSDFIFHVQNENKVLFGHFAKGISVSTAADCWDQQIILSLLPSLSCCQSETVTPGRWYRRGFCALQTCMALKRSCCDFLQCSFPWKWGHRLGKSSSYLSPEAEGSQSTEGTELASPCWTWEALLLNFSIDASQQNMSTSKNHNIPFWFLENSSKNTRNPSAKSTLQELYVEV